MFKITDLKELIRAVDKSTITELTIKGEGKQEVTIKRGTTTEFVAPAETVAPAAPAPTPAPAAPAPAAPVQEEKQPEAVAPVVEDANLHKITSPMVGTFYSAPSPDSDPYVKAGDKVTQESVVCIVEAMKLMNELEAEINGEIVEVLVENGQLVEYGQPLFLVKLS
ncbi:acetyl-CoA carboxylase biotin carboxyl carrier protein [Alkalihalobacterium chitinilyticum]|uniref:Biotin carboxyl carrier protein of acetyl-CoA carboxylase n=1 Tax=Alkalihalobacterium chitinilyticum TaxID=2980103 RepID=A0ABT5VAP5_9BACI|nr:acetyl-CoA carboxylase biotin carboxyl carrier protein [Alkalihalobacterium chitinilyticum]MDE5412521.1 acetyl-CoA carboxylase biotin carboxyl carrier protein [Alkalihalobacterium chitinilyticum]